MGKRLFHHKAVVLSAEVIGLCTSLGQRKKCRHKECGFIEGRGCGHKSACNLNKLTAENQPCCVYRPLESRPTYNWQGDKRIVGKDGWSNKKIINYCRKHKEQCTRSWCVVKLGQPKGKDMQAGKSVTCKKPSERYKLISNKQAASPDINIVGVLVELNVADQNDSTRRYAICHPEQGLIGDGWWLLNGVAGNIYRFNQPNTPFQAKPSDISNIQEVIEKLQL